MNKEKLGILVALVSTIILFCLLFSAPNYNDKIIDDTKWNQIIKNREATTDNLINTISFNDYNLFFDTTTQSWYYSLIEGNKSSYNPSIKIKGNTQKIQIAFLNEKITDEIIKNNRAISFMVYSDTHYRVYSLNCTTLPLMNITYNASSSITKDKDTKMNFTLFDNRNGVANRVVTSDGKIHVRGNSTSFFPKKGYRLSLTKESIGNNTRKNHISLLGMRQDDDWILYAAYNDQEKIRNVFATNLWMYSCAENNLWKIRNGMEYRYIELFLNNEYWGLYALGFPIDEKQLQLNKEYVTDIYTEYQFKKAGWNFVEEWITNDELTAPGFELQSELVDETPAWELLKKYYKIIYKKGDKIALYELSDIQNAINVMLFYNLIQGVDNINTYDINMANTFLSFKKYDNRYVSIFTPWDMDFSFGNTWEYGAKNATVEYGNDVSQNIVMLGNVATILSMIDDTEMNEMIQKRYTELRNEYWSNENINRLLNQYENTIYNSGAFMRDSQKWPESNHNDFNEKLNHFREYVLKRLEYMDMTIYK